MTHIGNAPGFYGKLRSHGDFVGRRIPHEVRDCFDRWLQEALMRSKLDLGPAWLQTWVTSPLWRFVVADQVCGERAWTGVMMPSMDRVGRCFPLLIATGVSGTPSLPHCLTLHDSWFQRLEALALSSLEDEFSVEVLDSALVEAAPPPTGVSTDGRSNRPVVPLRAEVAALAIGTMPALAEGSLVRASAWWTEGSDMVTPSLAICAGLPEPATFPALLDGRWAERGWKRV